MFTAVDDDSGVGGLDISVFTLPCCFRHCPTRLSMSSGYMCFLFKQIQDRQMISELYILHLLLTWRSTYTDEFAGLYGHVHIVQALTDNHDAKG